MSRPTLVAVGSLIAIVLLAGALHWRGRGNPQGPTGRPLVVYAAPAVRVAMEAIARDYEAETGQRLELRFGPSEDILTKAGMPNPGEPADLFLPADDSYVRLARGRGLVAEGIPITTMRAVVLVAPGNPKRISTWADLLRADVKVAVPNPGAAVGKIAREHLVATGAWVALRPRAIDTGTVTEAANAAKLGSVDAAIVWDAVAAGYTGQTVLGLPELAGAVARVEIAVLTQSPDAAAALRFARYATAADRGLIHFRTAGFRIVDAAGSRGEPK